MDDRTMRGLVGIALAVAMLVVGSMAGRIFPVETAYVLPLFVFAAAIGDLHHVGHRHSLAPLLRLRGCGLS